jgi:hypothetical protein
VVVLRKRDFLDLDNPLLAWMLDYDAVSAVLKALPAFKKLKQEQMEHIFDRCGLLFALGATAVMLQVDSKVSTHHDVDDSGSKSRYSTWLTGAAVMLTGATDARSPCICRRC